MTLPESGFMVHSSSAAPEPPIGLPVLRAAENRRLCIARPARSVYSAEAGGQ